MPRVIFEIKFSDINAKNRSFYNGTAAYNYFSYTENENKAVKENQWEGKNYMEKTSGVFNRDGALTQKQKAILAEKLKNTGSIIWHGFISFDNDTSPLFATQEKCVDFIRENFDVYFRENRLNPDNMELFCSLHGDTDNNHIHFCFFEKEPTILDSKGKLQYRRKGVFRQKFGEEYQLNGERVNEDVPGAKKVGVYADPGHDNFIYAANNYIDDYKISLYAERNVLMKEMSVVSQKIAENSRYKELRAALKDLRSKLPNGRTKYGSDNMRLIRPEVDKAVTLFLNTVPDLRKKYTDYMNKSFAAETRARNLCKTEGIRIEPLHLPFAKQREDLKTRLGNAVITMAKGLRFDTLKDSEFVVNDLGRKISAKMQRRAFSAQFASAVKKLSFGGEIQYDFSKELHAVEREIELDRQRRLIEYGA